MFSRRQSPGQPLPAGQVDAIARTHVGRVRLVNEDRFLVRSDSGLWAVADGMGGHEAGALAATIAIDMLNDLADRDGDARESDILDTLERANRAIFLNNRGSGRTGGTTIVVAKRGEGEIAVYWAGDSRAYWIGQYEAKLLTRDHSLVQEWVDAGLITDEAAQNHPRSNIVTRALGASEEIALDRVRCEFAEGDRILLCSDGLSRSQRMSDLIAPKRNVIDFADRLLAGALQRDGSDNVTLVALESCTR